MSKTHITLIETSCILSRASGYIKEGGFDYAPNPYKGCLFGCHYCYAAFFADSSEKKESWERWVEIKSNALELIRKCGDCITGKRIYMSSVTDSYQPVELRIELTRKLLEELIPHLPSLVVQTRSPFLARDIDILQKFIRVKINMTISTDDDNVQKAFEPYCASIGRRFEAIEQVKAAGVKTGICLTPLLPISDVHSFSERLRTANADVYVAQVFQISKGRFSAGTLNAVLNTARQYG